MTPPPPVHHFILTNNRSGRWFRLKAICSPTGMETRVQTNFEPDEKFDDYVYHWQEMVMDEYQEVTGLDIDCDDLR